MELLIEAPGIADTRTHLPFQLPHRKNEHLSSIQISIRYMSFYELVRLTLAKHDQLENRWEISTKQ